jgi:hypothetical protein
VREDTVRRKMRESDVATVGAGSLDPRFEKAMSRLLFEESKTVNCTFLSGELGIPLQMSKW